MGIFNSAYAQVEKSRIEVFQLSAEPTIDGELDAVWEIMPVHNVNQLGEGVTRTPDADYGVTFRMGWKNNKLFLFFDIVDDVHVFDPTFEAWRQDYIIPFFNFNETHETDITWGEIPAWQFRTTIPTEGATAMGNGSGPTGDMGLVDFPTLEIGYKIVQGGYFVEMMIDLNDTDWEAPAPLAEGLTFGFDVEAADIDQATNVSGVRKHQLFWNEETGGDTNWLNLEGLGIAVIRDEILGGTLVNETDTRSVKMYPNPASDLLFFENLEQVNAIQITTLTGQIVRVVNALDATSIDISGIASGIYLVVFDSANLTSTRKLIVK